MGQQTFQNQNNTQTSINIPRGTHQKRQSFVNKGDMSTSSQNNGVTIGSSKFQIHPILQGAQKNSLHYPVNSISSGSNASEHQKALMNGSATFTKN